MHTPGPWIIEGIESPVYGSNGAPVANGIGIGTQSRHVATVYTGGRNAAVINHANAALISAAPDLLEALKAARNRIIALSPMGFTAPELWSIDQAIAKAEGRN